MDINSIVSTLLSGESVSGISKAAGSNGKNVQSVLGAALPMLLNGAKTQSSAGGSGFADALLSHGKANTSNLASFMSNVDLTDGGKIVGHLLGNRDDAVGKISKKTGVSTKETGNILAAAAPLLMSLLGQSSGSNGSNATASAVGTLASSLLQNVDVGGLLTGLLGGGDTKTSASTKKKSQSSSSGNILGDLLGSLLKG